jgi:hypothetical protein
MLRQRLEEGATGDEFGSTFTGLKGDSSNLIIRALELFRQKTGKKAYFKVSTPACSHSTRARG